MGHIKLQQINKNFGGHEVFSKIDLEVKAGEFLVILGASGGGKSTLLNMIAGLLKPSSGKILFDGEEMADKDVSERNVAYVFQDYALYPHMTVHQNIRFPLENMRFHKRTIDRKVRDALAKLKLSELKDKYPDQLSGGQKQRVAIGRAMVRDPFVFLFDEPLSSLDPQLRDHLRMELKQLHRQLKKTFVYVTHDQLSAMILGDRIAFLDGGTIPQIAPPEVLYHEPENMRVAEFLGFPPINILRVDEFRQFAACDLPPGTARVGIRPEHLRIRDNPEGNGRVEWIQEIGFARYADLKLGSVTLSAKCDDPDIESGQPVACEVETRNLICFDKNEKTIKNFNRKK